MIDGQSPVRDLGWWHYGRKWKLTLDQAARLTERHSSATARWGVRLSGIVLGIEAPVFIVGCPRSGTTFLGEVLQALPDTSYYYEPPVLKYRARHVYEGRLSVERARSFYRSACRGLLLWAPGKGRRLVEKTPSHLWVAHQLLGAFPDARFLVITRDGRDVVASLREKPWHRRDALKTGKREPGEYLYGPYPHFYIERDRRLEYEQASDVRRCAWIWRRHAEESLRLRGSLPAASQLHLRYEALIEDRKRTVENILDYLSVEQPGARALCHAAASKAHSGSIGRWKTALSEPEVDEVVDEAGAMLAACDYV